MHIQGHIWGEGIMPWPSPFGEGIKQKSAKYTLKSRNQIIVKHAGKRGLRF